jgi:hypothetical protein
MPVRKCWAELISAGSHLVRRSVTPAALRVRYIGAVVKDTRTEPTGGLLSLQLSGL